MGVGVGIGVGVAVGAGIGVDIGTAVLVGIGTGVTSDTGGASGVRLGSDVGVGPLVGGTASVGDGADEVGVVVGVVVRGPGLACQTLECKPISEPRQAKLPTHSIQFGARTPPFHSPSSRHSGNLLPAYGSIQFLPPTPNHPKPRNPRNYICSGADIPIRSRHRARTVREAETSFSRALESGSSSPRTRHFS